MMHLKAFAKGAVLASYKGFEDLAPEADLDVAVLINDAGSAVGEYNERLRDGSSRCNLLQLGEHGIVLRYETGNRSDEWTYAMTVVVPWHAVLAIEITPVD